MPHRALASRAEPIGRGPECEHLARAAAEIIDGGKRAVVITGPAGIGKTTLLRWAAADALARGALVGTVRVPAAAGVPPRYPVGELLEGLRDACIDVGADPPEPLLRVIDTLRGVTSAETYPVALPQVAAALDACGEIAPIAMLVDDHQWAPREGADLLLSSMRATEAPLLFVATSRADLDTDATPPPTSTADLWVDELALDGFDADGVALVGAAVAGGALLPSLVTALEARTLGNALFVTEVVRAWRDARAFREIGGYLTVADLGDSDWPDTLNASIALRLDRSGADEVAAAAAIAVLGRASRFEEIRDVTGIHETTLVEVLDELLERGIIEASGATVRFRVAHPLYEQALLRTIGRARKAALHEATYRMLRGANGVSASELAHHALAALTPPPDVGDLLEAAASEALSAGSYKEAAGWFAHLVELAGDAPERLRALEGQAGATVHFDPRGAVELYERSLALGAGGVEARLLTGRAYAKRLAGDFDGALRDLDEALPRAVDDLVFDIEHGRAVIHGIQGRIDEADAILSRLAKEYEETPKHAKAIGHLGQVAFARGELAEARALWERALSMSPDRAYAAYLEANLVWVLVVTGEWHLAESLSSKSAAVASAAGDLWNYVTLLTCTARLRAWQGNYPTALDLALKATSLASRTGNIGCIIDARDALAVALLENDHAEEALEHLQDALGFATAASEGRELAFSYAVLSEAFCLTGRLNEAQDAITRARAHLKDAPIWHPTIDRVQAQILLQKGGRAEAELIVDRAISRPAALPFESARLLELAALIRGQARLYPEAKRLASLALHIYDRLGAAGRARRLRSWANTLGPRTRGRPRSRLPYGVTPRELEVLELVAQGMTNREIAESLTLATGTVKKHVESLLSRLGVSRRSQLVPLASGLISRATQPD